MLDARRAAQLDGSDDRREAVVEQHDVGGLAGDIGAGGAHRHPDVGRPQRRPVVDPVARHRDDVAAGLQRAGRSAACPPGSPGPRRCRRRSTQLRRAPPRRRAARRRRATGPAGEEADLTGDGLGRRRVVARDHHDADAGPSADRDRVGHCRRVAGPPCATEPEQRRGRARVDPGSADRPVVGRVGPSPSATGRRLATASTRSPRGARALDLARGGRGRSRAVAAARSRARPCTCRKPPASEPTCAGGRVEREGRGRCGGRPRFAAPSPAPRRRAIAASIGSPRAAHWPVRAGRPCRARTPRPTAASSAGRGHRGASQPMHAAVGS